MTFSDVTQITKVIVVFEREEMDDYVYWYSNRYLRVPNDLLDVAKWRRGQELAGDICTHGRNKLEKS